MASLGDLGAGGDTTCIGSFSVYACLESSIPFLCGLYRLDRCSGLIKSLKLILDPLLGLESPTDTGNARDGRKGKSGAS